MAYDAATGAKLWLRPWGSPQNLTDRATSVTVSPDGGTVFVTGSSDAPSGADYVTVAYDAATGAKLWARRYNGASNGDDFPGQVVATRNAVYVTGRSIKGLTNDYFNYDYLTVAYDAATGATLWVRRYNGTGRSLDGASGVAYSMAVSPTTGTVFITGHSMGTTSTADDYATIAYSG